MVVRFNSPSNKFSLPADISTGVWMSCWASLDAAKGSISLYAHGPQSVPLLVLGLGSATINVDPVQQLQSAALTFSNLSYPCLSLVDVSVISSPNRKQSAESLPPATTLSMSIKFQTMSELWCWTMSIGNKCKSIDCNSFNMPMPSGLASPRRSDDAQNSSITLGGSGENGSGGLLMYVNTVLTWLCEREMLLNGTRKVTAAGGAVSSARYVFLFSICIFKRNSRSNVCRFQNLNGRVILTHRVELNAAQVVEGSVLISVNNFVSSPSSAHIALKLLNELPRALPAQLTFWRFPRFQGVVICAGSVNGHNLSSQPGNSAVGMKLTIENGTIQFRYLEATGSGDGNAARTSEAASEAMILRLTECQIHVGYNDSCGGPFSLCLNIVAARSVSVIVGLLLQSTSRFYV
jgi:hypothetical protein